MLFKKTIETHGGCIVKTTGDGLHAGESQERDGDYYGPAVNRAARVMGIGHAGQIIISEVTAMLKRDSLLKTPLCSILANIV